MDIDTVDRVIQRIKDYAIYMNWSKCRLAKEAKMRPTTLRDFDEDSWNPTRATLKKLEVIIPKDFTSKETREENTQ